MPFGMCPVSFVLYLAPLGLCLSFLSHFPALPLYLCACSVAPMHTMYTMDIVYNGMHWDLRYVFPHLCMSSVTWNRSGSRCPCLDTVMWYWSIFDAHDWAEQLSVCLTQDGESVFVVSTLGWWTGCHLLSMVCYSIKCSWLDCCPGCLSWSEMCFPLSIRMPPFTALE